MSDTPRFVPLVHETVPPEEVRRRARAFAESAARRRSVRSFSSRPVPREVIEDLVRAAGTAPSGANLQPWRFVAVSDPALKRRIREAAEEEEGRFYGGRAPDAWLEDLSPLGTGPDKPFLETAPWLIAVFALLHAGPEEGGGKHYYVSESVGIACGVLLAAVHSAGLCALTHTPSPMRFLGEVLGRPRRERPYLLIPVGYPAEDARVPDIRRKPLDEILEVRDGGGAEGQTPP